MPVGASCRPITAAVSFVGCQPELARARRATARTARAVTVMVLGGAAVDGRFAFEPPPFLVGRFTTEADPEPVELVLQPRFELIGPRREPSQHARRRSRRVRRCRCPARATATPTTARELVAQTGVVQRRQGALIVFDHPGVERVPSAPIRREPWRSPPRGCAGAGRRCGWCAAENRATHSPWVSTTLADLLHRHPRVGLRLDERQHPSRPTASWAARTAARVASSPNAGSSDTDLGALNVTSYPRADARP